MNETNVIMFPIEKKPVPHEPPSINEVQQILHNQKQAELLDLTEILGNIVIDQLHSAGLTVMQNEEATKDVCFFLESLKSLLYKHYQLEHPFQHFADQCFVYNDDDKIEFIQPVFRCIEQRPAETDDID